MDPLRVEFVEPDASPIGPEKVLINGLPAETEPLTGRIRPGIRVQESVLLELLSRYSLRDLQLCFQSLSLPDSAVEPDLLGETSLRFSAIEPSDSEDPREFRFSAASLYFDVRVDVTAWARPWTLGAYIRALDAVVEERSVRGLHFARNVERFDGLGFMCTRLSLDSTLGDELHGWSDIIRSIHEEASAQLVAAQYADSLTTTFHFPPAIATACEQYLLYFVQFLADLGIEAEAEVQHSAAEVLFRVTPTEGREALERVREALDAYLRLPTDPSFAVVAAQETGLAVRQLEANVFHLQGQLSIAKAVLQAKDAQIEALELSNFRLRQIGGGGVQTPGSGGASAAAAGEDTEALIPGVVSVKEVEKGGFVLHTPAILRRLKRFL